MDPVLGAAMISAGANLAGGLMGRSSAEKATAANIALQKQFAQKGIQWRVADANKAGIHPLYAMGAATHSFSPVAFSDPMPNAMANMGQDISRAVASTATAEQRVMQGLVLENAQLQNDLLRKRIAQMDQVGPAVPATHSTSGGTMTPIAAMSGLPWSGAPGWSEFPGSATVSAPSDKVEGVKIGGYNFIRNPQKYSAGQTIQNEYDEHVAGAAGVMAAFDAWVQAMERDGYLAAPQRSREYLWADAMRRARAMRDRQRRPWGE